MKTRLIAFIFVITAGFGNSFAEKVLIGDLYYNLDALTMTAEVTYNNNTSANYSLQSITIPPNVTYNNNTYNVTSIGNYAFRNCTYLTSVTIPNSVTIIGYNAFEGCTVLTSITIPNSVTSIMASAFKNCTRLTSITIPNSVTFIGVSVFSSCSSLKSITIPNGVTIIDQSTFFGCTGLTSVIIPSSVTIIGQLAFRNCSSLSSITIPNSVTTIAYDAFSGCSNLTSVTLNSKYVSASGSSSDNMSTRFGTQVTEYIIGNDVTSIGNYAFYGCSNLTSVTIGNSVTSIGEYAFWNCSGIKSVIWNAKNSNGWYFGSQVESFVLGDSVEVIPDDLCKDMKNITILDIPHNVVSIGNNAFKDCGHGNSLVLPSSLKSIGDYAFKGWTNIKKIHVPNEVETIGAHAFDGCALVTSIYLGIQVAEIGDYAFNGCIRVNDITSMNTTAPIVYAHTLNSISRYAYLYVQAGSKRSYQIDPYWSRFDIREIASEGAIVTRDAVTVEANDDNAVFTWPKNNNATTYTLQITKEGEVFCTLSFNANGQLNGIAFAPRRDGALWAQAPTTSISGMSFSVTGLSGASKYAYRLAVIDASDNELIAYRGEFATTGYEGEITPGGEAECPEGLEDIQSTKMATKILHDGQIYILRGEKIFNLQGAEVK